MLPQSMRLLLRTYNSEYCYISNYCKPSWNRARSIWNNRRRDVLEDSNTVSQIQNKKNAITRKINKNPTNHVFASTCSTYCIAGMGKPRAFGSEQMGENVTDSKIYINTFCFMQGQHFIHWHTCKFKMFRNYMPMTRGESKLFNFSVLLRVRKQQETRKLLAPIE